MSKSKEVKVLAHGEVQKKILEKPLKVRSDKELIGLQNRYRDENFEIYKLKKKQFLEACKKYNRLNQETLICNKKRLLEDYTELINFQFLEEVKEQEVKTDQGTKKGSLQRKRTERPIHSVPQVWNNSCILEPWFARYLKLNKFIWAARKKILMNRLLRVLEKLKTVTVDDIEALEKPKPTFPNVSYAEIFEKFM